VTGKHLGMKNILDLTLSELKEQLAAWSEPKFRAGQVFSLLHKGYLVREMPGVPASLAKKLESEFLCIPPEIVSEQVSKVDGTRKYLLKLHDGALVECVLLFAEYGATVCVSTQVGCKMGCRFCASGRDGFVRDLSAGEILSQVVLANRTIRGDGFAEYASRGLHIVLMGSGEPLDNFDSTIRFLDLATCADGMGISSRNISLSTVGLPDQIRKFAEVSRGTNLCISLHASNDEVRRQIMPMARRFSVAEVVDAAKFFFKKTGRRVIFEYSMIDGVNCDVAHAGELAKLLKGFPAHVNLISLNATGGVLECGKELKSPPREVAMKFMDALIKSGVSCTMRKSRGADIDGACGMLKLRKAKEE